MPQMSTFRAIMALYCGWIEQEILWCTMLSADALYMIAELYSLRAPISKCMQGRLQVCLLADPLHMNLFGILAWGGMNHSIVMSMASNMSHEQRHSEVDVPTRKVDLIENIAPVPAIATTMRSDADIFLLIIATIVIEIDMITACHLTPPMGHYSMC